jgi:hypothetical protein
LDLIHLKKEKRKKVLPQKGRRGKEVADLQHIYSNSTNIHFSKPRKQKQHLIIIIHNKQKEKKIILS